MSTTPISVRENIPKCSQILTLVEQQIREDEAARQHGRPQPCNTAPYPGAMTPQLKLSVLALALQHLQLADTSRLPVERTTLQALLKRWGGLVQTGASVCPACDQRPNSPAPASIDEPPPPLDSGVLRMRNVEVDLSSLNVRRLALQVPTYMRKAC